MRFLAVLQAPYPHTNEPRDSFISSSWIGLVVAIALFCMQIGGMAFPKALFMSLEFGLISACMSLFIALVTSGLQSNWFDEQKWTVGKQILFIMLHLAVIALANMIYTKLRYPGEVQGFPYLAWVLNTCMIGLAPVTVSVFMNQYRLFKRNNAQAIILTEQLQDTHESSTFEQNTTVQLTGDNQGEVLDINIADFLYAESADNYVVVYYLRHNNNINNITSSISPTANFIFRSTLKRISLQLEGHNQVLQCHRSYLVNTEHIVAVAGNAAGLKLTIAHCGTEIPVSRNLIAQLRGYSQR
jgi:DNA-binding LytR/AlgR family response regulator